MKKLILVGCLIVMHALILQTSQVYAFKFLDDTLDIKGNVQQTLNIRTNKDVRDVRYSSFRTMFRIESMYTMISCPNYEIKLYGLANYYNDEALAIDDNQRKAIRREAGSSYFDNFARPGNDKQWLKEVYLDIKTNTFQARLGKQLVSWGETTEARVTDVINPLDTTYLIAFPDWEDFKIGVWMARLFYTPENMWQNLAFEAIIIPFDFEPQRVPPAGSGLFFGPPPFGSPLPATGFQMVLNQQYYDRPASSPSKSLEAGLRIKGYWGIGDGIDWTISHFYTRLDSPLVNGNKGYINQLKLLLGFPHGKVFIYPHYNSTGATFATTVGGWLKSTIRGEAVWNRRDYQFGTSVVTSDVKEKNLITTCLNISRNTMIPYIKDLFGNRDRSVTISFYWYQYWLLHREVDAKANSFIRWESGKAASQWTKFSLSLSTGYWFDRITPMLNLAYDATGTMTTAAALIFQPGDHWQWMANYQHINTSFYGKYQDQVILSARYEFW
jgi:hypothetical protein